MFGEKRLGRASRRQRWGGNVANLGGGVKQLWALGETATVWRRRSVTLRVAPRV